MGLMVVLVALFESCNIVFGSFTHVSVYQYAMRGGVREGDEENDIMSVLVSRESFLHHA